MELIAKIISRSKVVNEDKTLLPDDYYFTDYMRIVACDYVESSQSPFGLTVTGYSNNGSVCFREFIDSEQKCQPFPLGVTLIDAIIIENRHGKTTQAFRPYREHTK